MDFDYNSHMETSKQELKLSVDNALPVQYIGDRENKFKAMAQLNLLESFMQVKATSGGNYKICLVRVQIPLTDGTS